MEQENNQFEDSLMGLNDEQKDFAIAINEKLLKEGCKVKIASSKTVLFSVKYTQGRKGVLTFSLRKKGLKVSIYARNFEKYLDALNSLHGTVLAQIADAPNCKNMVGPKKCWDGCMGYNIPIGEEVHQKCSYYCFQFDVDAESVPSLVKLLDCELEARQAA